MDGAAGRDLMWRRSGSCADQTCVEVAAAEDGHILIRDGKHPDGPVLGFTPMEWAAFLAGVKRGEFDR